MNAKVQNVNGKLGKFWKLSVSLIWNSCCIITKKYFYHCLALLDKRMFLYFCFFYYCCWPFFCSRYKTYFFTERNSTYLKYCVLNSSLTWNSADSLFIILCIFTLRYILIPLHHFQKHNTPWALSKPSSLFFFAAHLKDVIQCDTWQVSNPKLSSIADSQLV